MTEILHASDLTDREKRLLFWASFLSLMAAGVGFAFRMAQGDAYAAELQLTKLQQGGVFGAALWPIALTMIGFSLVIDRTGYKLPMYAAFLLQAASGVLAYLADGYEMLYTAALCAGLGHGIVEAVINPVCAAVYPKQKTKWLTILHASWPAGLVLGTLLILGADSFAGEALSWQVHSLWILLPVVAYGLMYLPCRFPVDERVQAGVPYMDMLRQVGFLTAALASALLIYVIGGQLKEFGVWDTPEGWFELSLYAGAGVGLVFGLVVRSLGRPVFFLMCLAMIPVATAELGTDGWIRGLMTPVLAGYELDASMALVFSAAIMLVLRVFAGGILAFFSPPALLCVSGIFSAVGLYWLSSATGVAIFIAFVLYALGQTYYWPCVLGFTSERYPEGGALTLNTVSAIGLLSVGVIGAPILGMAFDESIHDTVTAEAPALVEQAGSSTDFLWMEAQAIDPEAASAYLGSLPEAERAAVQAVYDPTGQGEAQVQAGRDALAFAVRFPLSLVLVFGAIALWFRSRGGYRPIELDTRAGS